MRIVHLSSGRKLSGSIRARLAGCVERVLLLGKERQGRREGGYNTTTGSQLFLCSCATFQDLMADLKSETSGSFQGLLLALFVPSDQITASHLSYCINVCLWFLSLSLYIYISLSLSFLLPPRGGNGTHLSLPPFPLLSLSLFVFGCYFDFTYVLNRVLFSCTI